MCGSHFHCAKGRVLAIKSASNRLNWSDHFLSRSEILEAVVEVVAFSWSVDEEAGGRLEENFADLSGLTDLEDDDDEDFLVSAFFFSASALKPEELWPSTTPTTDTSAGSTRVELRVSISLTGVDDLASLFSFLSFYEGVESCAFCSGVKASQ